MTLQMHRGVLGLENMESFALDHTESKVPSAQLGCSHQVGHVVLCIRDEALKMKIKVGSAGPGEVVLLHFQLFHKLR